MLFRVTLCTVLALVTAVVQAQEISNQQLLDEIKSLREDLAGRVGTNEQEIANLKEQLEQLTTVMNNQDDNLRKVLDAISTTDSSGQAVPDILANVERSPQFKQDFSEAVHRSMRADGTFTVTNRTNSFQKIWVNRTEYGVNPGQQLTLQKVPLGTVTTQLPGQQAENWSLAAPSYSQGIEIVPTSSQTTVYRPLTEVYSPPLTSTYSPPVYYWDSSAYYYEPTYLFRPWWR